MIKVDIISGFLGAGKTTFIKKMIEEVYKGQKIVLIENEFGEVGVDGGFLKDAGIEISELNSGCICCSLVGDFDKNLREVIDKYSPDRILIEPSGVGKLSDVMASVVKLKESHGVEINALVTVVNALKASKQMKAFGEFFNNQIEFATTVVLSRTQNATPEQLEFCVKQIQALNPKAAIVTTEWDKLSGEMLLKVMEGKDSLEIQTLALKTAAEHHHHHHHDHDHEEDEHEHEHHHHHDDDDDDDHDEHEHHHHHDHDEDDDHDEHDHDHDHEHHHHHHDGECCCGHHHDHDADEVFANWGIETPHKFTRETIEKAMEAFANTEDYGAVIRSKGMVETPEGSWIYFDFVDGEYELRDGAPDYTGRLCVIGADIDDHKLAHLFGVE